MADATTLVKYLAAHSGYSRRNATDLIKEGKVTIANSVITEPWHEIEPGAEIKLDGKRVKEGNKVYFLLNKPVDYITTMEDDLGRQDVSLLMRGATKERIFPIGRLDKDTTGLLIFTNDGDMAQCISHPRFKMQKEYQVTLDKPVNPEHLKLMFKGVFLPDGNARVDRAALMPGKRKYVVIVELHSGKKHIIRRLFQHFGYEVRELDRIQYAGLTKKGLPLGKWRALNSEEIEMLKKMAEDAAASAPKPKVGKPRTGKFAEARTDYRKGSRPSTNRFGSKPGPKFRDGQRVERPDIRRKKELIIGTEEWFAQDDAKPVERSSSQDERPARFDSRDRNARPEREETRTNFRRSDSGLQKDYTPKRTTRPHADRAERASWSQPRESGSDVESWFNGSDDARPARSQSRSEGSPRFGNNRSQSRDDRGERPAWREKRDSNASSDFRPARRFNDDRGPRRDDRSERPAWREKREEGVEGSEFPRRGRTDFRNNDERPARRFNDERPARRFDSGDSRPNRFDRDRGPRRDDRSERPAWRDKRETSAEGSEFPRRGRTDFRSNDERPARRFNDERPARRFDSGDSRPNRFDRDRGPRRDDRSERPAWRDKRETSAEGSEFPRRGRTDFRNNDERPARRFNDERPARRFDSQGDRPSRFNEDRPRRDDRTQRPSWSESRESGSSRTWSPRGGDDAKPRTRSKAPYARSTSSSVSGSKPARMVRTKPAHIRTKPGGGKRRSSR